jgi:hypothetical protein
LLILAPLDFSMAMAQGWHNLPALYGQKVRHVDPIKDFSSGAKEGVKVFLSGSFLSLATWTRLL